MEFIKPCEDYLDSYLAACIESHDNGITEWMPVELDRFDSWKANALKIYKMLESGEGLPDGIPKMITFWCVEDGKFIGEIQIRPYVSQDEAQQMGHIGYAVRYSMWNKGFGTKLLIYAVKELRKLNVTPIYISCHVDNLGSNHVSKKIGFEFVETRGSGADKENLYILY